MNQNTNQVFKAENLDWKQLQALGIPKEKLEKSENMQRLLQGEITEVIPLKLRTSVFCITMDATLRIVKGPDGKPVVEINGISPEGAE